LDKFPSYSSTTIHDQKTHKPPLLLRHPRLVVVIVTLSEDRRTRKKSKMVSLFNPKKLRNKLRRRKDKTGKEVQSVDGHKASSDNQSLGNKSVAVDSGQFSDAATQSLAEKGMSPKSSKEESNQFTVVKPVPYDLLLDDIINIRVMSFPDKADVIASFPISVASVMVQRSMESRTNDPLKPSELTTTFIQEPSAQLLRWGVELKVTLCAVEVKPRVPRVIRTKVKVDDVLDQVRDKYEQLGKHPDDIKKELQKKEAQLLKEENDLNWAIVHHGYGKGENDGAGQEELRLRQMFYCDREHNVIARKVNRRTALTYDEKEMMNDIQYDPTTSMKKKYNHKELQILLEQLAIAFPVIERANGVAARSKTGV